jgi:hypothetical protein
MPFGLRAPPTCGAETIAHCPCFEAREVVDDRGAFRRVATTGVAPGRGTVSALVGGRPLTFAPFSPRRRRRCSSERSAETCLASASSAIRPCGRSFGGDARCVGPTSAVSLLVRVPAPRGFPMRHARCACAIGETACFHGSAVRFGGRRAAATGVVFPSRCVRAVPLASLSLPARLTGARAPLSRVGCRDHLPRERVNVDALDGDPRCLPSTRCPCPAAPSRASGSGVTTPRLASRDADSRRL